jgi:hypothetical protein
MKHLYKTLTCKTCDDKGKVRRCVSDITGWELVDCPTCSPRARCPENSSEDSE